MRAQLRKTFWDFKILREHFLRQNILVWVLGERFVRQNILGIEIFGGTHRDVNQ